MYKVCSSSMIPNIKHAAVCFATEEAEMDGEPEGPSTCSSQA